MCSLPYPAFCFSAYPYRSTTRKVKNLSTRIIYFFKMPLVELKGVE